MNGELAFLLERLLPVLNEGVLMSLKLIIPSSVLGLAFGVLVGACRNEQLLGLNFRTFPVIKGRPHIQNIYQ